MTLPRALLGIFLVLLLGIALYIVTDYLTGGFEKIDMRSALPGRSTSTPTASPTGRTATGGEDKNFRGPTGDPYIVGPKSNPPNY